MSIKVIGQYRGQFSPNKSSVAKIKDSQNTGTNCENNQKMDPAKPWAWIAQSIRLEPSLGLLHRAERIDRLLKNRSARSRYKTTVLLKRRRMSTTPEEKRWRWSGEEWAWDAGERDEETQTRSVSKRVLQTRSQLRSHHLAFSV